MLVGRQSERKSEKWQVWPWFIQQDSDFWHIPRHDFHTNKCWELRWLLSNHLRQTLIRFSSRFFCPMKWQFYNIRCIQACLTLNCQILAPTALANLLMSLFPLEWLFFTTSINMRSDGLILTEQNRTDIGAYEWSGCVSFIPPDGCSTDVWRSACGGCSSPAVSSDHSQLSTM